MSKVKKVRTSITINPEVLQATRDLVGQANSDYKSVAHFIEQAVSAALVRAALVRCEPVAGETNG